MFYISSFQSGLCNRRVYYGRFYRSAMEGVFYHLNLWLVRWAQWKYKKLRGRKRRANSWLGRIAKRDPSIFAHWKEMGAMPAAE
jgi:RNA-directed DNA polymerase